MTKRVVKSPKVYFVDTGLLCYLLRIETPKQLVHSPFAGHIFENMIVMEKVKNFSEKGERAPCYFYRTSKGVEVDLIIDFGDRFDAYEIKFSATPTKAMTNSLAQFKEQHPVNQALLLNLRKEKLPFSNGVVATHWTMG